MIIDPPTNEPMDTGNTALHAPTQQQPIVPADTFAAMYGKRAADDAAKMAQPAGGTLRPPSARTGKKRWPHVLGYALTAGVFLAIGIGAGSGGSSTPTAAPVSPAPAVTVTETATAPAPAVSAATVAPKPTPKPAPVKATIPDGYSADVPGDVPAGKYKTHSDSADCYYSITKTGNPDDIIDNGGFIKGTLTVTLKRGQTFGSTDCGDWTQQ
jgi:hypothetical protein